MVETIVTKGTADKESMKNKGRLLIYGANGAVGRRLAEIAVAHGVSPVLAGRRRDALEAIAGPLRCEVRLAGLDDVDSIMNGIGAVVSCVAPYTRFGEPVLRAAINNGAHYVDLTGEPHYVASMLTRFQQPAVDAGVTLVPSAGLGLCCGIAARAATDQVHGVPLEMTVGYRPWSMVPSAGTIQSTMEILAGGALSVHEGALRRRSPGGLHMTQLGIGTRFPLTDALTLSTVWPGANIDCFLVGKLAPAAAPVLCSIAILRRSAFTGRILRFVEESFSSPLKPGGAFKISVAARSRSSSRIATVDIPDTYELTSRAAYIVATTLQAGGQPSGVLAAGAVVKEPVELAERLGVSLTVC